MPEFPGGELALRKYIGSAIKYPVIAQENGIQGKVYVTFVVGKEPHLQNCTDKTDTFAVSTSVGEQTCEWLNDNLDRYGFLCDFLDVAYTCPETCGACSIVRGQINTI